MWRGLLLLACAACGSTSTPPPAPTELAISLVAPRADEADVEVAKVNGRPVWGSCVAGQVRRGADRAVALQQCIELELLAEAAEQRGLARAPDVIEAARTAMVSQLVAREFEDRYRTPAELGERLDKVVADNAWRMHRPELRGSTYVRIKLPAKDTPPEQEAKARDLAATIAAELAGEAGLLSAHVEAVAERITQGTAVELDHGNVQPMLHASLDRAYADALFAIPEVGRTAGPVRTRWGWDVILWTGGLPAKETTREELAGEAFPDVRRAFFQVWVNKLVKERGIQITVDQEQVAKLDDAVANEAPR